MAKLADALASGASGSNLMRVRLPLCPPLVRSTQAIGKTKFFSLISKVKEYLIHLMY